MNAESFRWTMNAAVLAKKVLHYFSSGNSLPGMPRLVSRKASGTLKWRMSPMVTSVVSMWKKLIPAKFSITLVGSCCVGLLLGGCNATETTIDSSDLTLTFQPAAGTYDTPQSVKISTKSSDALVCYSESGRNSSSLSCERSPVSVYTNYGTTIIDAYANVGGYTGSTTAATYDVQHIYPPMISLSSGTYTGMQHVYLSDSSSSSAKIYYTTNGDVPTIASTLYTGAIAVSSSETIRTIAVYKGVVSSSISSATYTINNNIRTPTFCLASGIYGGKQYVGILADSSYCSPNIYYTTNGSDPTTSSTLYTGAIAVSSSETIKAIAAYNGVTSSVSSVTYTIVSAPTFSLASGAYRGTQTVSLTSASSGASIYYTTNGDTPTVSSALYMGSITIDSTKVLKAIAVYNGVSSSVSRVAYMIGDTLKDPRDGHKYKTVMIGSQIWMAQNLNYKPSGSDSGWCYNDSAANCTVYGRLYTWAEAMGLNSAYNALTWNGQLSHQGICPNGWRVPSDVEWDALINYAGGNNAAGTKLKSTSGWFNSGNGADSYGVNVLPAGNRYNNGVFGTLGSYTSFWSSSESDAADAWYRGFGYSNASVSRYGYNKSYGFSLRCVEN